MAEQRVNNFQENQPFTVGLGAEPVDVYGDEQLQRIGFRPTLIIGLGGTGVKVLGKLKSRLRRHFDPERRGIFQLLALDTDQIDRPRAAERLEPVEQIYLGNIDGNGVVTNLAAWPHIRNWWPEGYLPGYIGAGAKAVRCVGRLALFMHIEKIVQEIESARDKAAAINNERGYQVMSAKAYIVTSVCGGTGSGMFIDVAYIVRKALSDMFPDVAITGILVLPDAFYPLFTSLAQSYRARANAYSALKELDHFMFYRDFEVRYNDKQTVSVRGHPPFDICYIVEATNENAAYLGDIDGLSEMIAEEIFLEIASPLQAQHRSQLDNVDNTNNSSQGKRMAYSSFAVGALVYPSEQVVSWCADRDTARLIQDALLNPVMDSRAAEEEADRFLELQHIRESGVDEVLQQLNRDAQGQPFDIRIQIDEVGDMGDETESIFAELEAVCESEFARAREGIEDNRSRLWEDTKKALHSKVYDFLLDPRRGPLFALWFLEHLKPKVLVQREQEMVKEVEELATKKDEAERQLQRARTDLQGALARRLFRRGHIKRAASVLVDTYNEYMLYRLELELRNRAVTFYSALLEEIDVLCRKLTQMVSSLRNRRERLIQRCEEAVAGKRVLKGTYILAYSALDYRDLRKLYEKHSPTLASPDDKVRLLSAFYNYVRNCEPGFALLEGNQGGDKLSAHLSAFLQEHYQQQIGKLDLVGLLKEIGGDDQITRRLSFVFHQTAPFWNYDRVVAPEAEGNLQPINLVGYHRLQENDPQWEELRRVVQDRFTPVPTNDPQRIQILRTKHGLPLYSLRSVRTVYRSAYEAHADVWRSKRQGTRPLHASQEWEKIVGDLLPVEQEYNAIMFAVGFALGFIYNKESWYYARAHQVEFESFKEDHRIAQGLEQALRAWPERYCDQARADVEYLIRERMVSQQLDTLREIRDFIPKLPQLAEASPTNRPIYLQMKAHLERFMEEYRRILM